MPYHPRIFREYDVRGLVGEELDADVYLGLGRAVGTYMVRQGDRSIVVGRDVRPSSDELTEALREGLMSTGLNVLDLGTASTPMVVFGQHFYGTDGSAAVTASHNPAEFNGLKVRRSAPVFAAALQDLRVLYEKGEFSEGEGREDGGDVMPHYLAAITTRVRATRALKVVADAGNGCASLTAQEVLDGCGFDVDPLYCEPDGTFPNHHPDPTIPKNLVQLVARVKDRGADCGVAFDGDADRMVLVDEKGDVHWPDRVLMLLAQRLLPRHPGGVIIHDVKCSQGVQEIAEKLGGRSVMVKTGYPYLLEAMRQHDALLGGELSGHMYFGRDPLMDFDDGVYTAARVLEVLSADERPVSLQFADLPYFVSTPELRVEVPEARKFAVVAALVEDFRQDSELVSLVDTDGARAAYPEGWGLVRASNTGPTLVLVFEARTPESLESVKRRFVKKLARYPEIGPIP